MSGVSFPAILPPTPHLQPDRQVAAAERQLQQNEIISSKSCRVNSFETPVGRWTLSRPRGLSASTALVAESADDVCTMNASIMVTALTAPLNGAGNAFWSAARAHKKD